jgi:hypothetical protein
MALEPILLSRVKATRKHALIVRYDQALWLAPLIEASMLCLKAPGGTGHSTDRRSVGHAKVYDRHALVKTVSPPRGSSLLAAPSVAVIVQVVRIFRPDPDWSIYLVAVYVASLRRRVGPGLPSSSILAPIAGTLIRLG